MNLLDRSGSHVLSLKREVHLLDKKLIVLVKVTCKVWPDGTKSFHFSDFTASNLPQSTQKKKIKSPPVSTESRTTAPHHSLTSLQIRPFTSFSLSFSLPVGVGNNSYYFKSNQEFHFPISSSNQISSTPPLLQTLHFTLSLSLYPLATTTSRLFQSSNQTKIFTFPCL